MKFLDAQQQAGKKQKDSLIPEGENKMRNGNRLDQKDPQSLISSPRGSGKGTSGAVQHDVGAQKLAHELGVDYAQVVGTGPNGNVTEKDVRAARKQQDDLSK